MTIPDELIDKLLEKGSVSAVALEVGQEMAAAILHELTIRAPEEIQPSWPMVLAWSRFQAAYEAAHRLGRTDDMLKAAKAQADLLKGLY